MFSIIVRLVTILAPLTLAIFWGSCLRSQDPPHQDGSGCQGVLEAEVVDKIRYYLVGAGEEGPLKQCSSAFREAYPCRLDLGGLYTIGSDMGVLPYQFGGNLLALHLCLGLALLLILQI